jgi:chromosome partitioning protein
MTKKYVFANQKGGVTKTTTTVNSAVMASLCGKRTLLVDMDGQGNSTYALGYNPDILDHTIYTVMQGTSTLEQALQPTYFDPTSGVFFNPQDERMIVALGITSLQEARRGPDLLPNNILASSADSELQENPTWGTLLRDLLQELEPRYDDIYIDTNPSLGKLTVNALYSANSVIIPMTPETWSTQGMIALARSVMQAQKANKQLSIAGVLFTRVRYASHQDVMAYVRERLIPDINNRYTTLQASCFDTAIHEGAAFGEAANSRTNVILASPSSSFSLEYWKFFIELLHRTQGEELQVAMQTYQRLFAVYQEERARKKDLKKQPTALTGGGE